jgi:Tfp pilus assembly PilM family ATPase
MTTLVKKIAPSAGIPFLSGRRTTDLLGIDLVGGHVKLVYAKEANGNVTFERVVEKKFSKDDETEIAQFLRAQLKELRVKKERQVLCIVPSTLFIAKNVDMPSRDPEEIRKIVDLQANRYTPYSRDELVIDYLCMETPKEHYTHVLLVIMNRKLMEQYCRIFELAGLDAEQIVVAPEGMANAYHQAAGFEAANDTIGGIHIGHEVSDLTILDHGQTSFVRSIPVGADRLLKNEEGAQLEFMKELNKSVIAYQNQGTGKPIKHLMVTGVVRDLGFMEEEIRKSVPTFFASSIPIKIIPYEKDYCLGEAALRDLDRYKGTSFFEIVACLASHEKLKVDLTPKEIKVKRRLKELGRNLISVGVTVMSAFLMVSLFLVTKIYFKHTILGKLNDVNKASFSEARTLEHASTQSRFIRSFLQARGKPLYIFQEITNLIGNEVYLTNFVYENEELIRLTGTANSMSMIFNFVTSLESSEFFSNVATNQTKSRRQGGRDVADFEIECTLREEL